MYKMKVTKTLDLLPALEKRIRALHRREVEIGMFASQGKHEESGFSYVGIFKYLSDGNPAKNLPGRSVLHTTVGLNPLNRSSIKANLKKYLKGLASAPTITPDDILQNVGEFYREKARDVFGDESLLAPKASTTKELSNSPKTPLIETGDLASKIAYKLDKGSPVPIGR